MNILRVAGEAIQEITQPVAEAARGVLSFIGKAKADALTDQASLLMALANDTASDRTATTEKAAAERATADQAVVNGTGAASPPRARHFRWREICR